MSKTTSSPRYRDGFADYADIAFQVLSAQISSNYLKFIKSRIIPELENSSDAPLRELRTLMTISHYASPIPGSQIARLLNYDPATVTRSTRWLIENNFIVAKENELDARSILYGMTPTGLRLSDEYRAVAFDAIQELNEVDPEQPRKKDILNALSVLEKVRNRSEQAARLAALHKRNKKKNG